MLNSYNDVCSICFENVEIMNSVIITECSHVFCLLCSAQWFYLRDACPNCNHDVTNIYKINKRQKIKKKINLKSRVSSEYRFKKKITRNESTFKSLKIGIAILAATVYVSDFFFMVL